MCESRCSSLSAISSRSLELDGEAGIDFGEEEQVGDGFEGIVDFVRDAGGQPACGSQLL